MKKTTFGIITIILLTFSACKKDNNSGGWWNFKGNNNMVSDCRQYSYNLIASDTLLYNKVKYPNVLEVTFYHSTYPPSSGIYKVSNGFYNTSSDTNQVVISLLITSQENTYFSTSSSGKTVDVSVSGGKINVSGSDIEMVLGQSVYGYYLYGQSSDSSTLAFNITQLR